MNITGQCHCGAIKFTAAVDPAKVFACHCADCQVISGAPFRAVVPAAVGDVHLSGTPKHYVKLAASGNRRAQAFCGDCGTQLYASDVEAPQVLNLRLGCINERAELPPQVHVWRSSGMPWLQALDAVPAHAQGRDSPRLDNAA